MRFSRVKAGLVTLDSLFPLRHFIAEILGEDGKGGDGERTEDGGQSDVSHHPGPQGEHHLLRDSSGVQHGGHRTLERYRQRHHKEATLVPAYYVL